MSMEETVLIQKRASYPNRAFRPVAADAWGTFFKHLGLGCVLAHWHVDAYSGVVRLVGMNIDADACSDDALVTPSIAMMVEGFVEGLDLDSPSVDEQVRSFQAYVVRGIQEAFESSRVQSRYAKSGLPDSDFAISWSPHNDELEHNDALAVIWSNAKRLTAGEIKKRQKNANAGKRRVVKKKRAKKVAAKKPLKRKK